MFRFCLIWNPQTIWIFLWRLQKYQNLLSGRAFLNFRYVQLIGYPICTFVFRIRAAPKNKEKRSAVQESQGRIAVLDGRQPACVLRLALDSFFLIISGNCPSLIIPQADMKGNYRQNLPFANHLWIYAVFHGFP